MMENWDTYLARIGARGNTRRQTYMNRESRFINAKTPHTLSYFSVSIDGVEQDVAIINRDNLDEKWIYSLPGETLPLGGYVDWMDNHWLITELDANTELRYRAKMQQCNYLLRWIGEDLSICEQWCIIEDGTKYLTGEFEDRDFFTTRGDSRIAMTIARNNRTKLFDRQYRFLIDDPESEHMLAYALTKPLKLAGVFNNVGYYKFVLQEVNTTDDDNQQERIADYYKFFPSEKEIKPAPVPDQAPVGRQEVWL